MPYRTPAQPRPRTAAAEGHTKWDGESISPLFIQTRLRWKVKLFSTFAAVACTAVLLGATTLAAPPAQARAITHRLDIPAQDLGAALKALGAAANEQILFSDDIVAGLQSSQLKGEYSTDEAITHLLKGSGLKADRTPSGVLLIRPTEATSRKGVSSSLPSLRAGSLHLAQGDARNTPGTASRGEEANNSSRDDEKKVIDVEEILVTGSHIRGKAQSSSPLLTITREDISRTGYLTVSGLMATVPQNFAGVSGGTSEAGRSNDAGNASYGTAVDLRGLGADTTLILVNGHRLAPSGYFGAFSDVSVIPLSAVERVEIMTDGASAIYGSDAIGGVVNYILTEDFSGAETSVAFGDAASGDQREYRISQGLGTTWDSGHALLSYEYHQQDELLAHDRDFAAAAAPSFLMPKSDQHSAFGAASQELTPGWTLRGDGSYSERSMDFQASIAGTPFPIDADTKQYAVTLENEIQLAGSWSGKIGATHGGNDSSTANAFGNADSEARLTTVDVMADGALDSLPGGALRAAIGAQYRDEKFDRLFAGSFASAGPDISAGRSIYAGFAELSVPVFGPGNRRPGIERLQFDLAARFEHYSDFGSTTDPKFGFVWAPAASFQVRGTVSSSFKAPNFQQLMGGGFALLENSPDPMSPSGESVVLLLIGENPELEPQRSTQWTAGLDVTPVALPGFRAQLTYFDIRFDDRLASPDLPILEGTSQAERDAAFIHRNPSLAEVTAFVDAVGPENFTDVTAFIGPQRQLADVTAIADSRTQNIATTDMRGMDLLFSHRGRAGSLEYEVGLAGTYLFEFESVPRPGFDAVEDLNQFGEPIDLRVRATSTLSRRGLGGTLAINHQGNYWDETGPTPTPIDSWTTVDLQLNYRTSTAPADSSWDFALTCLNVSDEDPPRVVGATLFAPVGYDSANANPLGRTFLARVRKNW